MNLSRQNAFNPLPPTQTDPEAVLETAKPDNDPLGPLKDLVGKWEGPGFNNIWRPFNSKNPREDSFLQLNLTRETLSFERIKGNIPNRGLLQPDIDMFGVHYLQQVFDVNTNADPEKQDMIHFEPGIWLNVPSTTGPAVSPTVCRMASIPHGTTVLAQGPIFESVEPRIVPTNIVPFPIGQPASLLPGPFEKQFTLDQPSAFRSPPELLANITQSMVTDPNSVLSQITSGQTILHTTTFVISSATTAEIPGGGTANSAFLAGNDEPNANAAEMTAIFWIETVKGENGEPDFLQLQYTQRVLLNFAGLSWPHISVATLRKVA